MRIDRPSSPAWVFITGLFQSLLAASLKKRVAAVVDPGRRQHLEQSAAFGCDRRWRSPGTPRNKGAVAQSCVIKPFSVEARQSTHLFVSGIRSQFFGNIWKLFKLAV